VLASTEDVWTQIFREGGAQYQNPKLVLFTGVTRTACGTGQSAMGPFYCPGDYKVYLDMDFFNTMSRQLGAPGEFARAYVVAHEVGHHVQNLLGISGKVDRMRGRVSEREQNAMSVRLELQADCLAGIWANKSQQAKSWLEQGDIESAMNAAQQIGDDKLQREATGTVRPTALPTAPAPSVCAGSPRATRPAASRPATPSQLSRFEPQADLNQACALSHAFVFGAAECENPGYPDRLHGILARLFLPANRGAKALRLKNHKANAKNPLGATITPSMTSSFSNLHLAEPWHAQWPTWAMSP
jgi:hypothetical protein